MHYEFVPGDEIVIAPGRTVKRIRALVAIAALGVSAGDVGGYVEADKNLRGNAWVSGNARVSGNAQVSGNAWVSGNAQVSGNAAIFWASRVGTENGTFTAYKTKDGGIEITRGCFRGSIDEFLAASEKKHDDRTHLEYRLLVEVAYSRLTTPKE